MNIYGQICKERIGRVTFRHALWIQAALACMCMAALPTNAWAALEWRQREVRMTARAEDTATVGVFAFTNKGTAPVTIIETKTSCACSVAQPSKRTYGAGESGEIKVTFTHGARTGDQTKVVEVRTDDAESNTALTLAVFIPALYTLEPSFMIWHGGEAWQEKAAELVFHDKLPVAVRSVASSDPSVSARLEVLQEGQRYKIWLQPKTPAAPARLAKARITVETDLAVPEKSIFTLFAVASSAGGARVPAEPVSPSHAAQAGKDGERPPTAGSSATGSSLHSSRIKVPPQVPPPQSR